MDIRAIKNDIILEKNTYYFDFCASALALKSVEEKIAEILPFYANTHSDSASHSKKMTKLYQEAKNSMRQNLEIPKDFALISCGFGTSSAIKKFQEILGIYAPPALKNAFLQDIDKSRLPLVIVSAIEHHSNELSFKEALCECVRIGERDNNTDLFELERICKKNSHRKMIFSFSAASNITGVRTDLAKISQIAKKYGAILAIDATCTAPYENLKIDYDAMFFASHKMLGGIGGCGFLAIKKDLIANSPTFAAGGTVNYVCRSNYEFIEDKEALEEGGTPAILGVIRSAEAVKFRNKIGLENIKKREDELKAYFLQNLRKIQFRNKITLYAANVREKLATFSLNSSGISPYALANELSNKGIQTRAGCACAGPYAHDLMNLSDNQPFSSRPGFLRISLHYSHDFSDIDYLLNSLEMSIKKLNSFY